MEFYFVNILQAFSLKVKIKMVVCPNFTLKTQFNYSSEPYIM
jgi:hypothetical protein